MYSRSYFNNLDAHSFGLHLANVMVKPYLLFHSISSEKKASYHIKNTGDHFTKSEDLSTFSEPLLPLYHTPQTPETNSFLLLQQTGIRSDFQSSQEAAGKMSQPMWWWWGQAFNILLKDSELIITLDEWILHITLLLPPRTTDPSTDIFLPLLFICAHPDLSTACLKYYNCLLTSLLII